jgi:eukaryotic-like serine/threonine-protein kinase
MPLSAGEKLGPYEILAPIGKGGMGEVYKARDTRLDRIVALKVSAAQFGERFEREAKAIAALNHPNICTLHDVGPNYLVMEYVEGAPLKGPLRLDQALKYAVQICAALDDAHKKGITHRDLKPANILATKSGIKLLDFGLAKWASAKPALKTDDGTLTAALTGKNEIVGTLSYMSPEQLQAQSSGQEIDGRSDIFSFGLVLYEMLTGNRAFQGSSPANVIAAIMERPAPSIADVAPPALDRVLQKCLVKDPDNRWQSVRDLKDELEWIRSKLNVGVAAPSRSRFSWVWAGTAIAAMAGLSGLAFVHFREAPPPEPLTVRFQIPPPEKSSIDYFKLSPDGRSLAFTADRRLWIRSLDTLQAHPLPGTEGADEMFWSPDSQLIAFFARGKLNKIAASGGPVQILCSISQAHGGSWNRDGVIVLPLSLTSGLFQVSAGGGTPVSLAKPGTSAPTTLQILPEFLPDGRHFLYWAAASKSDERGIYVGSLDGTPPLRLLPDISNASYVRTDGLQGQDGYLVFRRGQALMAQRFNPAQLSLSGEASPIAENVGGSVLWAAFSVSEKGTLVYAPVGGASAVQLAWWDRGGTQVSTFGPPGIYNNFRLSPDEKRITYSTSGGDNVDVWVFDSIRGVPSRLTFDPGIDDPPMWSPDGSQVVWASDRAGSFDIYIKSANGAGPEQLLVRPRASSGWPEDWSRDGRFLLYQIPGAKTGQDIWIAPQPSNAGRENREPFPYLQSEFDEKHGRFSPDGRWVAYSSNESGRDEVYVRSFPLPGARFQISADGGIEPQWRKDGTELFYIAEDRTLMAVPVKLAGAALEPGQSKRLFPVQVDTFIVGRSYEVSNDGQRFLIRALASGAIAPLLTVVLNWQTRLK